MFLKQTTYSLCIVLAFNFFFFSCGSDAPENNSAPKVSIDDLTLLDEEPIVVAPDSTTLSKQISSQAPAPKMTKAEKKAAEEREARRKEIVKKQLEKSEYDNCEEVFKKYEQLTNDYLAGKNRWKEWDNNDPVYAACRKKIGYSDKFDALDEKMDIYDNENF